MCPQPVDVAPPVPVTLPSVLHWRFPVAPSALLRRQLLRGGPVPLRSKLPLLRQDARGALLQLRFRGDVQPRRFPVPPSATRPAHRPRPKRRPLPHRRFRPLAARPKHRTRMLHGRRLRLPTLRSAPQGPHAARPPIVRPRSARRSRHAPAPGQAASLLARKSAWRVRPPNPQYLRRVPRPAPEHHRVRPAMWRHVLQTLRSRRRAQTRRAPDCLSDLSGWRSTPFAVQLRFATSLCRLPGRRSVAVTDPVQPKATLPRRRVGQARFPAP